MRMEFDERRLKQMAAVKFGVDYVTQTISLPKVRVVKHNPAALHVRAGALCEAATSSELDRQTLRRYSLFI